MRQRSAFIGTSAIALALCLSAAADKESVENTIISIEKNWASAVERNDGAALGRIIAEDCVITNPMGRVKTKAEYIDDIMGGAHAVKSLRPDSFKVRVYGATAVVNVTLTIEEGLNKGVDIHGQYRHMDVFVKGPDGWRCVGRQVTEVVNKFRVGRAQNSQSDKIN